MKEYKLLKKYPNSPEVGSIVEYTGRGYTTKDNNIIKFYAPIETIEYNPEFWQKIENEYPKIFSFKKISDNNILILCKDNKYSWENDYKDNPELGQLDLDWILNKSTIKYIIYQVAKSKDEIFTIGDKVSNVDNKLFIIEEFEFLDKYGILVRGKDLNENFIVTHSEYIEYLQKYIPKSVFVTEDGKKINIGDTCFLVIDFKICTHNIHDKDAKYFNGIAFSTKEAAEKYIDENKPIYTKKNINNALKQVTFKSIDDRNDFIKILNSNN